MTICRRIRPSKEIIVRFGVHDTSMMFGWTYHDSVSVSISSVSISAGDDGVGGVGMSHITFEKTRIG